MLFTQNRFIFFRCRLSKGRILGGDCLGAATLDTNSEKIYLSKVHNHEENSEENCKRNLKRDMYIHAADNPKLTPSKVFKAIRKDRAFNHKVGFGDVERNLQKHKAKSLPRIPKSVEELITALENGKERGDSLMSNYCGYSKMETSGSVAGVIFGHPLLINNFQLAEEMSYDGTFKVKNFCLFFSELFLAWNRYV